MQLNVSRRRWVQLCCAGAGVGVAGCQGSGTDGESGDDNGSGNGGGGNGENGNGNGENGAGIDRPGDWPDDPAFMPNPDVEGPGGDVTFAMQFEIRDFGDAEAFETFEVDFERVVLRDAGGSTVDVPVERTVNFYEFDLETTIVPIFDVAIPAATYTDVEYHMDAVEIVHEEEGDVTEFFEDPPTAPVGNDGEVEIDAGDAVLLSTLQVDYGFEAVTLEESLSVGYFSAPGAASDPSTYEEE